MLLDTPKEATDLLDVVTLVLDEATGPWALAALAEAETDLAKAALEHAEHWFSRQSARTLRAVRTAPDGAWIEREHIDDVATALHAALAR